MRHPAFLAALAVAVVLGFALASPRAAAQADVPTHDVGDAVGFGATIDLTTLAQPLLDSLNAQDQADGNFTINELNFTGSVDIWVYQEVTAETSTVYTIRTDSAAGLKAHFVLNLTSSLFPVPGTYTGILDPTFGFCSPPPNIPMTTRTVDADVQIAFLDTASGTSQWNVSDFALRESSTNQSLDLRIRTVAHGVPSVDLNETTCQLTVSYEDRDLTITADVDTQTRMIYAPSLDVFDFPINDGETWGVNATATVAGQIGGTIDVVGLDPTEEQDFFNALNEALNSQTGVSVTGLTGFPIVLQDITVTIGTVNYLGDGVIHDYSTPVELALSARQAQKTLADGNFHDVYLISAPPSGFTGLPTCSWVYSPDDGFIVGYTCEVDGVALFELENVPPGQAKQDIEQTKVDYAVNPPAGNPVVDFFLKPPFFGLLIIVAAVIVVAALLIRRPKRPEMMPPPMPPEAPPQAPPPAPPPQGPPPETPPPPGTP